LPLSKIDSQHGEFERRTLLKATAWGGAAVVFSVAAPAASASPSDASGWGITMSMTTGPNPTSNTTVTRYQWAGTSNGTQPRVTWYDEGSNTWSTGIMTVSYVVKKNTSSTLSAWTSSTPYKLDSATRYNSANVSTNSSVLAVNDILPAFDGRNWTCVSISESGTGVNRETLVVFNSATDYTSQPGGTTNTVYLPRLGVKLDFTLTFSGGGTTNAGKPFLVSATWEPDQSQSDLFGIKATAGPSF